MVENFLSLFDFQGGSLFLEKDEKNERDKKKEFKKVTLYQTSLMMQI